MPLQATSGAASYDAFGGGVPFEPTYIEQIFQTWLYTGNNTARSIDNGIDLSTKGGLVWIKGRSGATDNALYDTVRGATKDLVSNTSGAETTQATGLTSFATTGFSIGALAKLNTSSATYASWTFRKQPKFFDVVTYTGTGSATTFAHNLGSVPGCIIVKCTNQPFTDWRVYHRSLTSAAYTIQLNATSAESSQPSIWNSTAPTSTVFSVGADPGVNNLGDTYVAYLFAHNAGGFGLTGTDNVISCGSFTSNASDIATVDLGFEPQFVMMKSSSATGHWWMADNMRGFTVDGENYLRANSDGVEAAGTNMRLTNTGFYQASTTGAATTYIYIAIRRGPMKVPTTGTSVFEPVIYTGDGTASRVISSGAVSVVDMAINKLRDDTNSFVLVDRLRGLRYLETNSTSSELTSIINFDLQNGVRLGDGASPYQNVSTYNYVEWNFRRAPSFFDEVCYTGTGSATTVTHNLAVVPELMIVKSRSVGGGGYEWTVYAAGLTSAGYYLILNTTAAENLGTSTWNSTAPTSSVFSVGASSRTNGSGVTYVNYLFATCPGVSKVGTYVGTGTTLQVDCGFTGGARFVLIKRTDSTGAWYVWDSARGIVAGNDPYLLLNSAAAEVTGTDYIDTSSAGFEISSTAPAAINASGGSFIFLAIA